jgi:hypothetical protein
MKPSREQSEEEHACWHAFCDEIGTVLSDSSADEVWVTSWTRQYRLIIALLISRPNGFENDNTTDQEQQREQELDQAWDFLISGALEAMREPERRQWLADQRKEEELRT